MKKTVQCNSDTMTVEYVNEVVLEVHEESARRREEVDGLQWTVGVAKGIYLFHYRTQKLSPHTPKVLATATDGLVPSAPWMAKRLAGNGLGG